MDPIEVDSFTSSPSFEDYIDRSIPTFLDNDRTICDVAAYHSVHFSDGSKRVLGGARPSSMEGDDEEAKFAIERTTFWDTFWSVKRVETIIRSSPMKKALKTIVPEYCNQTDSGDIKFNGKPKQLFHFLGDVFNYGKKLDPESEDHAHIGLLVSYLKDEFRDWMVPYQSSATTGHLSISFPLVWTMFKDGELVYIPKVEHTDGGHLGGVEMVVRQQSLTINCKCDQPEHQSGHHWRLVGLYVDSVGGCLDYRSLTVSIPYFGGTVQVEELCAVPLDRHSRQRSIRTDLQGRGEAFVKFRGRHYCQFSGTAQVEVEPAYMLRPLNSARHLLKVDGRIMVDDTALRQTGKDETSPGIAPPGIECLSNDDYIICSGVLAGYSFLDNKWGYFGVENMAMLRFDTGMFTQNLVIKEQHKKLLRSLVPPITEAPELNGPVQKQGAVTIMLHGGSGRGKTMTAESIAEYSGRPLVGISTSDLFKDQNFVDDLTGFFYTAQSWGAVVLLDEADLLLGRTSPEDWRGRLFIKALLNVLDWHGGFVVLTTSCIKSIDQAFISRIQLTIYYPPPTPIFRRMLWLLFLRKLDNISGSNKTEAELEKMSSDFFEEELNGRQIENIVRVAQALATEENKILQSSHLRDAFNEFKAFNDEFCKDGNTKGKKRHSGAEPFNRGHKRRKSLKEAEDSDQTVRPVEGRSV